MFIELPFGLTAAEITALKAAFEAGCFIPGSCACRRPSVPLLKEVAEKSGITESNFSHCLSNASRKLIFKAIIQTFPSWVEDWEHKNGTSLKEELPVQLTLSKSEGRSANKQS